MGGAALVFMGSSEEEILFMQIVVIAVVCQGNEFVAAGTCERGERCANRAHEFSRTEGIRAFGRDSDQHGEERMLHLLPRQGHHLRRVREECVSLPIGHRAQDIV